MYYVDDGLQNYDSIMISLLQFGRISRSRSVPTILARHQDSAIIAAALRSMEYKLRRSTVHSCRSSEYSVVMMT